MNVPYVVLIGNVGAGKSSLVEKITGFENLSSDSCISATRSSTCFPSFDGRLFIADTPGKNPMDEVFSHNLNIAYAMNLKPVSRIVLVVKADTRIDQTMSELKKYVTDMLDFKQYFCVCVTHMDLVTWNPQQFETHVKKKFRIDHVIFSGKDTNGEILIKNIRSTCKESVQIRISKENFLKYFDISDDSIAIIESTKREVEEMKDIRKAFYEQFNSCPDEEKADMICAFQAWIREEIIDAQKRVAEEHGFTFYGEDLAIEAGHIANMTNQLKGILFDVRTQLPKYQQYHGVSELRECPHCHLVWAKLEGCDGSTTCGNRLSSVFDGRRGVLARYTFRRSGKSLSIMKTGRKCLEDILSKLKRNKGIGCGGTIVWKEMKVVPVPRDFSVAQQEAHTEDVKELPREVETNFGKEFDREWSKLLGNDIDPYAN